MAESFFRPNSAPLNGSTTTPNIQECLIKCLWVCLFLELNSADELTDAARAVTVAAESMHLRFLQTLHAARENQGKTTKRAVDELPSLYNGACVVPVIKEYLELIIIPHIALVWASKQPDRSDSLNRIL